MPVYWFPTFLLWTLHALILLLWNLILQPSWQCKLATVESFKADVSRVSPSSEQMYSELWLFMYSKLFSWILTLSLPAVTKEQVLLKTATKCFACWKWEERKIYTNYLSWNLKKCAADCVENWHLVLRRSEGFPNKAKAFTGLCILCPVHAWMHKVKEQAFWDTKDSKFCSQAAFQQVWNDTNKGNLTSMLINFSFFMNFELYHWAEF